MFGRNRNTTKALESRLGYSFRKKKLLETALVHRSFRFETEGVDADNQRLEFLGDAALGLVSAEVLYKLHGDADEGKLTCARSLITSGKALAKIGHDLDLGRELKLGKGEEKSGGRTRNSNITDALEAILGAAYLDGGLKAVHRIFRKVFDPVLNECEADIWADNPKGKLQEVCQRLWKMSPSYRQVSARGPAHARVFVVEVVVNGRSMGRGRASNKRAAETAAAVEALSSLE